MDSSPLFCTLTDTPQLVRCYRFGSQLTSSRLMRFGRRPAIEIVLGQTGLHKVFHAIGQSGSLRDVEPDDPAYPLHQ